MDVADAAAPLGDGRAPCGDLSHVTREEFQRLVAMDAALAAVGGGDEELFNATHLHNPIFNFSVNEAYDILLERKGDDRNLSARAEAALIAVYALLIVSGLTANLLVSFVVARRAQMHTARNLYIVNLTVSDITLCVVCMPFTLVSILRRQWTMGSVLCKLVPVLQGTNIMVSVGTITVIALDRYFTIVRRSSQDAGSNRRRVIVSIALIWLLSLLATLPIFFFQVVESFTFQRVVLYETCIERWPTRAAQLTYTVCVLLLQSVIPALVVSVVHARIASYLHAHAKTQKDSRRARKELERNRKTTLLLTGIAVMFAGSWLPLSLYSLLVDGQFLTASTDSLYVALAVCHLIAMSSAVSNPIVYGWLNSNIRHEFLQLLPGRCATSLQRQHSGRHGRTATMGGATTAIEDATTRTQLNASSAIPTQHRGSRNGASESNCRESMTLLLLPGSSKAVAASSELSVL